MMKNFGTRIFRIICSVSSRLWNLMKNISDHPAKHPSLQLQPAFEHVIR